MATTNNNSECFICYEQLENSNYLQTNCKHEYCISCFKQYIQTKSYRLPIECAFCRQHVISVYMINLKEQNNIRDFFSKKTPAPVIPPPFMEPAPRMVAHGAPRMVAHGMYNTMVHITNDIHGFILDDVDETPMSPCYIYLYWLILISSIFLQILLILLNK